ncbi:hypothetical protein D3C79_1084300 [compost metagenome]
MHGIRARLGSNFEQLFDVQVGVSGTLAAECVSLIGLVHVQSVDVGISVYSH